MRKAESVAGTFFSLLTLLRERFFRPAEQMTRSRLSHAQFIAISTLHQQGALPMRDLADRMQVSKQQLTPLVCKLAESGLVLRKRDERDRRIILIEISKAGQREIEIIKAEIRLAFAERLGSLSDSDLDQLQLAMERIYEILKNAGRGEDKK